ncbi:FxSxx-COOH protein [Actinokineospora sp. PR83]|uniref:FxSxx-COOH cyclophane-containing RiPP peptide n=1 Tax=Actinokineospora sp. PR83 TaxID=2884908 RepID=UPI0027E0D4EF|nr:FxSxx-COOH cyclophane-containing RiPP peptide [Actinokineospora sp. PR83]MCG8918670.1 FxSxx-COOH protein [Actinokineospora sp. PR83]
MDARRADTTADRDTDTTEAAGGAGTGGVTGGGDGQGGEDATTTTVDRDAAAGLPDLTGLDFADLEAVPESVLRAALRRVLADDGGPSRFAAFQNSL